MTTSNNAHDDIKLLKDDLSLEDMIKELKGAPDEDGLVGVLRVIDKLQRAAECGDVTGKSQNVVFRHQSGNKLVFSTEQVLERDWRHIIGESSTLSLSHQNPFLDDEDVTALRQQTFNLKFNEPGRLPPIKLVELLEAMDMHGIGRPSTYSNSIKKTIDRNWIIVDENNGTVKLTKEGAMLIHLHRSKQVPFVESSFSNTFRQDIKQIADGAQSHLTFLKKVFHQSFTNVDERELDANLWTELDELYENESALAARAGIIEKAKVE